MDMNMLLPDIDDSTRNHVPDTKVEFQGEITTLKSLNSLVCDEILQDLVKKHVDQKHFGHVQNVTVYKLDWFSIPNFPPYFINPTLVAKRKLNPKIFQEKCEDIFVFEGISYAELCFIAKPELVDASVSPIWQQKTRFICFRDNESFFDILKLAKHPVHRILYYANSTEFYWISTRGSLDNIRKFLLDELQEISASTLAQTYLSKHHTRPLLICGLHKIGKSLVLSELARKLKQFYTSSIVIFLSFISLVELLEDSKEPLSPALVYQVLSSSGSRNSLGKAIFMELVNNEGLMFEIFVDDFCDIRNSEIGAKVKRFFQCVLEMKNLRLYIASPSNLQYNFEDILGVGALMLTPETYLCTIWKKNVNIQKHHMLPLLAKSVLNYFPDVPGYPINFFCRSNVPCFQFFLLAHAYSSDVIGICKKGRPSWNLANSSKTLYKLYTKFINSRFSHDKDKKLLVLAYWYEAFRLLFATHPVLFCIRDELLKKLNGFPLSKQKIKFVGMGECQSKFPDGERVFTHKTIAEYFLAMFVCENLLGQKLIPKNIWHEFIQENVLPLCESSGKATFFGYILMEFFCDKKKSPKVYAFINERNVTILDGAKSFTPTDLLQILSVILQFSVDNQETSHMNTGLPALPTNHTDIQQDFFIEQIENDQFSPSPLQDHFKSVLLNEPTANTDISLQEHQISCSVDSLDKLSAISESEVEGPSKTPMEIDPRIVCFKSEANVLGEGSGGTIVYEGTYGNQHVAVKTISTFKNPKQVDTEIKILLRCFNHPNIVRYIAYEKLETEIRIALELCEKSTLEEWVLDQNCIHVKIGQMQLLRQITEGICYLHENDVIHRDLKPKNILFSINPNRVVVKIADFGISKEVDFGQSSIAVSRHGGSMGWKAAEILEPPNTPGENELRILKSRKRNDIFSLGCIFYFVLTNGGHPFGARQYTREANIVDGRTQFHENFHILPEGQMLDLIKSMVSKNPGDRPSASSIIANPLISESKE